MLAYALAVSVMLTGAWAGPGAARLIIGDYDAELRGADRRVDCELLVRQLKALGVNTYFWLIWHAETDWDDLHRFLPLAREAGIDVWVYLVPPSEPPPSKPFGLDFVRWGQEIARLSLKHSNLKGWVIDDFYANGKILRPEYVAEVQKAAKAINPKLVFYPLMYFHEIHYVFTEAYGPVIDGVVVAYPQDREEIIRAAKVLRDEEPLPARCRMEYPWEKPSHPGEMVQISRKVTPTPGRKKYAVTFRYRDSFTGPTEGYHFLQVLVDGRVVWEQDVAGGQFKWYPAHVDLTEAVAGKKQVTIALRCYDKKGVSNFGVWVEWGQVKLEGFRERELPIGDAKAWTVQARGEWSVRFYPQRGGQGRLRLPFIVMPAGSPHEFRQRHQGTKGAPQEVAAQIKMVLGCLADGYCDGMVIYCLPKRPGNRWFEAVRKVIAEMKPKIESGRSKAEAEK